MFQQNPPQTGISQYIKLGTGPYSPALREDYKRYFGEFGQKTAEAFGKRLDDRDFEFLWMISEHPGLTRYSLHRQYFSKIALNDFYPRLDKLEKDWFLEQKPVENRPGSGPALSYDMTYKGHMAAIGILPSQPAIATMVHSSLWNHRGMFLMPFGPKEGRVPSADSILEFYWLVYDDLNKIEYASLRSALCNARSGKEISWVLAYLVSTDAKLRATAEHHGFDIPAWITVFKEGEFFLKAMNLPRKRKKRLSVL